MSVKENALASLPFWGELSEIEQKTLRASAQLRSYDAGSIIHSRDQDCLGLIAVLRGEVRTFMLSEEGREITLYRIREGETDVLSASCVVHQITFDTQLIAERDTELLILPAPLLALLKEENIYIRCCIYEKLGERFSDAMHVMQQILFRSIDSRIAQRLLENADENGIVSTTHEGIAKEINSSREVISRTLKQWEKEGLVQLHRGKVSLLDLSALRDLAEQ